MIDNRDQIPGQMSIFDFLDQDSWFGKMSPEPSLQTEEKISEPSLKKRQGSSKGMPLFLDLRGGRDGRTLAPFWEMGGALLGEYTMRSFGESPNEERESRLSQILEANPLPKYSLSERACQGILRRAEKRGKELPQMLRDALLRQSVSKNGQEDPGGGKGILIQNERMGALSTQNHQSVCYESEMPVISMTTEMTPKIDENGVSFSLRQRDYKDPQTVVYRKQGHPQNAEQGQGWQEAEVNDTLNAFDTGEMRSPTLVLENHPQDCRVKVCEDGVFQTLSSSMGTGGGNVPMVVEGINGDICGTLDAIYYKGCGERHGIEREIVCLEGNGQRESHLGDGYKVSETMYTQNTVEQHAVCARDYKGVGSQYVDEGKCVVGSLCARDYKGVGSVVRRLTPLECERLQGYPDGWTDIGDWTDSKGKSHKGDSDSPRYKALGNSIALPFWQWMAERMVGHLPQSSTMASLFDGISGFCLCYKRVGCEPIWTSEIEEFAIAVCKRHFGDEETGLKGDIDEYL